jgi:hypothetical protein
MVTATPPFVSFSVFMGKSDMVARGLALGLTGSLDG